MRYIDAHTHLNSDELFPERPMHLQQFTENGGSGLVVVGVDQVWNTRALQIASDTRSHPQDSRVAATIGGHPSLVSFGQISSGDHIRAYEDHLCDLLESSLSCIVAVGECGIDAHYPGYTSGVRDLQQAFFRMQAELARRYSLPLVIHSRDDFDATREVLRDFLDIPLYVHCRGYTAQQICFLADHVPALWVGFCGNITYPKAHELRESLVAFVTHSAYRTGTAGLLLETDAPRLSHQARRGKLHAPAHIMEQYRFVADLLDLSEEELGDRIENDLKRLFPFFV